MEVLFGRGKISEAVDRSTLDSHTLGSYCGVGVNTVESGVRDIRSTTAATMTATTGRAAFFADIDGDIYLTILNEHSLAYRRYIVGQTGNVGQFLCLGVEDSEIGSSSSRSYT